MSERKSQPYFHIARDGLARVRDGREWPEAWRAAAEGFYGPGNSEDAQSKGCPRKTFLAVLSLGWVAGVDGDPLFLPDRGNAAHAVAIVRHVLSHHAATHPDQWPASRQVWDATREEQVANPPDDGCVLPAAHNGQVDVIRALWVEMDLDRVRDGIASPL